MAGLLDRIDAAIGNLCPCGAPPRDGRIYCSADCEPTHIGPSTISCAMRWQPGAPCVAAPRISPETVDAIRAAFVHMHAAVQGFVEAVRPALAALERLQIAVQTGSAPAADHPLARVAAQRRNRSHGPQTPMRPPRQLGPR